MLLEILNFRNAFIASEDHEFSSAVGWFLLKVIGM